MGIRFSVIISVCMLLSVQVVAQKKVKLERADKQSGGKMANGERFDSWIGNVMFTHLTTTIQCDSAIRLSKTNIIEAFGNVRIVDGDSVTVTSKKLIYDGNTQKAKLRENVIFEKLDQVTLYTDYLDYDRIDQVAHYFNMGKLVDSTNTLTSQKGYYQVNTNMASFKKEVVAVNPDYTLKSDTLQYSTRTNIIYFRAPTELTDVDGNVFNYNEGQYDTKQKKSDLKLGILETESYNIEGNKLYLDDIRRYYKATDNVVMTAKNDNVIITGDIGEYWRNDQLSKVYGNALMRQISDGDTLYLSADTLVSIDSKIPSEKRLLAYHNVRIFKSDLQGVADSVSYFLSDSTIHLYDDPVLWNEDSQMTADSINILMVNKKIHRLNMRVNSFVISKDTVLNFNQIKGRTMTAYFGKKTIDHILVNGNGESIYFALKEEDNSVIGMNRILCSDMKINFGNKTVSDILFYIKPEGKLIPPHELKPKDKQLRGFRWRTDEKPGLKEMLDRLSDDMVSKLLSDDDLYGTADEDNSDLRSQTSDKRPQTSDFILQDDGELILDEKIKSEEKKGEEKKDEKQKVRKNNSKNNKN